MRDERADRGREGRASWFTGRLLNVAYAPSHLAVIAWRAREKREREENVIISAAPK